MESTTLEIEKGFRLQWEAGIGAYILLYAGGLETLDHLSGEVLKRCDGRHTVNDILDELKQNCYEYNMKSRICDVITNAYNNGWIVMR